MSLVIRTCHKLQKSTHCFHSEFKYSSGECHGLTVDKDERCCFCNIKRFYKTRKQIKGHGKYLSQEVETDRTGEFCEERAETIRSLS